MKTARGRHRFVLIFPCLGIVVKLPVPFYNLKSLFRRSGTSQRNGEYVDISWNGSWLRLLWLILLFLKEAVLINWGEFVYYIKRRHPLLQPTYFSLFGIFNIQRYGSLCSMEMRTFYLQIDLITEMGIGKYSDPHHFKHPWNFSLFRGKLRILDYGGRRVQETLDVFADVIYQQFDPTREVVDPMEVAISVINKKRGEVK